MRLSLMPAGSFFQTNRIVLEAFCILSGDDFSGIFTIILIFYLSQTGAQSHSQRFKEFLVVLKLIKSQCTYHIFSLEIQFHPTLSPHSLVSLFMATLSQVLFFSPMIPSPSHTLTADVFTLVHPWLRF